MSQSIALISGTSNPKLSQSVANQLKIHLIKVSINQFADGEVSVQINENIRNKDVYVLQSLAPNPNDNLIELAMIADAARRSSAKSLTAVIPYMAYARQDRKDKPRVALGGKMAASIISHCGFDHLISLNLHSPQVEGFFDIPCDHLSAVKPLIDHITDKIEMNNLVVVAPDIGSVKIAQKYAAHLKKNFAIIYKVRNSPTESHALELLGEVSGKSVLLADDLCATGSTLVSSAELCREKGATQIIAAVSHGQFVANAIELIEQSSLDCLYVTNSIEQLNGYGKIQCVDVGPTIAHAIETAQKGGSISSLCY